jgi:hypothetical protein
MNWENVEFNGRYVDSYLHHEKLIKRKYISTG